MVPSEFRGDLPLGPFDGESIMSYCRQDRSPTVSPSDVAMTRLAYRNGP